jgi:hypothetical protein
MEYLTLVEASKLEQTPLRKGVIEVFARTSPVLERLPLFPIAGNSYTYNREQTLGGIAFRSINESYTADVGVVNPITETLSILGGISKVDRALVKTQGNLNDLRAIYDGQKSKASALKFTKTFFKGDSTSNPKEFDGLEIRLTGDQVIDMGSSSGGDTLTLPKLDELIDAVQGGPDVLFMNKTMRRKVNALVRSAGSAIETVNDAFGRQINAYAGVPIGVIEDDNEGNLILDFNEECPGGGSNVGTSIYAVRFGFEWLSGLQNGILDVIDLGLNGIFWETLIEWLCGLAVWHPKSAARLQGIKNA